MRKHRILSILILCLFVEGFCLAQALVPIDPGSISDGHVYLLEDTSDSSANSNTANLVGAPQVVPGLNGQAMQFNGSSDGLHLPDATTINTSTHQNHTVIAVFNCADVSKTTYQCIYEEGGSTRGLSINVQEGSVYAGAWNRADYTPQWAPGTFFSAPIGSGEWHVVAAVLRDGGAGQEDDKFEMWMDGALVGKGPGGQLQSRSDDNGIGTVRAQTIFNNNVVNAGHWFEGLIDEVWIINRALSEAELAAIAMLKTAASNPSPAGGATDILRDETMAWEAGEFAVTHDVYLGKDFNDVNDASLADPLGVLVSEGQSGTTFDPGRLEFGQTYYWRVDEVNAPPRPATFKGAVWDFTVEPTSYPVANVTVTASSTFNEDSSPAVNIVNGSGLVGDLHGGGASDMWLSQMGLPVTLEFAFEQVETLHEMLVWNHNQLIELILGFGAKDVVVETSLDGDTWAVVEGATQFNQAPGALDYAPNNAIDFRGAQAKYVKVTINSGYGPLGQVGLSEVRFKSFPVTARNLAPADETIVAGLEADLSWRSGRQSATAKVIMSKDRAAVEDGSAVIGNVDVGAIEDLTYTATGLDYASAYFWRIIDVNDTATPAESAGPVKVLLTPTEGVIDDMEMYKDEEFLEIWSFWVDGYNDSSNGSVVGIGSAPETTEVYEGGQSMPMAYDNSASPKSEATRTFDPPLNLAAGNPDTIGVYFKGVPYEFNGYYSQDGPSFWTAMTLNPLAVAMGDEATIGLALTSHNQAAVATGTFSDIVTSGGVSGDWTLEAIGPAAAGHPADIGSVTGATATLNAGGNDIWNTADEFVYAYKQLSGEGTIEAKVDTLEEQDNWTKAGVMIRNSADASASYASVQVTGTNGIRFQYRDADGVSAESDSNILDGTQELLSEPAWIKIERISVNTAAGVYLTITDSSNKSVKIAHPDPEATRLGSWTLLSIPMSELASLNLASIKSIAVGVDGAGATGRIYVDYLRLQSDRPVYYDLFAHYALDGDLTDSSGNGFDGTATGDPNYIDGAKGQGLEFDNADGMGNEYVTIGTTNPSVVSQQLSVAVWAKWNGLSGAWQGLIGKRDAWNAALSMWDIEANRDTGNLRFGRNGSTVGMGTFEDPNLPVGEWDHVGVTFDGSTVTLYKNGAVANSGNFSFGTGTDASIQFGCSQINGGNPFNGALDEIYIYDRAITEEEMAALATP